MSATQDPKGMIDSMTITYQSTVKDGSIQDQAVQEEAKVPAKQEFKKSQQIDKVFSSDRSVKRVQSGVPPTRSTSSLPFLETTTVE